jgi:hypothetical protein
MNKIALCLLLVVVAAAAAFPKAPVQIKGTVIYLNNDSIEIKKGNKEVTLQMTQNSKIIYHGKESDRRSLEICQKVNALYAETDGRKELVKLEIIDEGYCAR